jgi:glycosyltransferase involved in cell wall biosynthesis
MKVSLIITTYNRPDALAAVLESVVRQVRRPDETIIVDDGSDERTAAVVGRFDAALPRHKHLWQEHDGFRPARMRNRGIAEAAGDYIVLVDGDMVLHPQFVADHAANAGQGRYLQGVRVALNESATAEFLRRPFAVRPHHVGGLSKVKYLVRSKTLARLFAQRPHSRLTRIHSCNQSFWRDDLLEVNGFDERYADHGGEDLDLCARLVSIGVWQRRLRFLAVAYHLYHPPTANWSKMAALPRTSSWAEQGIDQHLPVTLPFAGRAKVAATARRAA